MSQSLWDMRPLVQDAAQQTGESSIRQENLGSAPYRMRRGYQKITGFVWHAAGWRKAMGTAASEIQRAVQFKSDLETNYLLIWNIENSSVHTPQTRLKLGLS